MVRRSSFPAQQKIMLQGVLGKFNVPGSDISVEYILTYASLDASQANYGQLLKMLVPVREAFEIKGLDFDHLLQRDLDDYRVSNEMIPYLLGEKSTDPRFFPPIVAVIVPWENESNKMKTRYPRLETKTETEDGIKLQVSKYGDVFSIRQEQREDGELAQSPVDLTLYESNAKLVIVDGQHRAMAMLATYRSAFKKWGKSEFEYFYESAERFEAADKAQGFGLVHLPVCIVYFPELTEGKGKIKGIDLTIACRKLFLDVNQTARHPSDSRQILLNDTDLAAFFTRQVFNSFQQNTEKGNIKLYHTEYDNPLNQVPIYRPFALTGVFSIYQAVEQVIFADDARIRNPMATTGKAKNKDRMERELELSSVLTEDVLEKHSIQLKDIFRNDYPKLLEDTFRDCFANGWGKVIESSLSKLYPFAKHIEAVDSSLKEIENHNFGPIMIARSALREGQGLRYALQKQKEEDKVRRKKTKNSELTNAEKGWEALREVESNFEKQRAKLYFNLKKEPNEDQISKSNRLFTAFRTNAFQNGLFMAFAYLKERLELTNEQFTQQADKWIDKINRKFKSSSAVQEVLFDVFEANSLRSIYKPSGGLNPGDWTFFRYIVLELLDSGREGKEIIKEARRGWLLKLYQDLYKRKQKELGSEEESEINIKQLTLKGIYDSYKASLGIEKDVIKKDLQEATETDDITEPMTFVEIEDDDVEVE